MTLDVKKEILKYKALNENYENGRDIYFILNDNSLDYIIEKIDEYSLESDFKNKINHQTINAQQFLELLDRFLEIYNNCIPIKGRTLFYLKRVFETNQKLVEKYFQIPYSVHESKYIENICDNVYKIIISNFIENGKHFEIIRNFIQENNLEYKHVEEYNFEESKKLYSLFSDIIFCLKGNGKIFYLFSNLDWEIDDISTKEKKCTNLEDFKKKHLSFMEDNYLHIFKYYTNRKKYLKYFKQK